MNNEPVAWIQDLNEVKRKQLVYEQGMDWKDPLYLHPAKTLTPITDEEIKERVKNSINGDWVDGYYDGVRWAEEKLRKAQEK